MGKGVRHSANLEAVARRDADEVWTVPHNLAIREVFRIGKQMASVGGGPRV